MFRVKLMSQNEGIDDNGMDGAGKGIEEEGDIRKDDRLSVSSS